MSTNAQKHPLAILRDKVRRGEPINEPEPVAPNDYLLCISRPGGGETIYVGQDEIDRYNADPDLFAAKYYGFATSDEYREWIETDGTARCSERTRAGKLCSNPNGGGSQLDAKEWRARHRSRACSTHGGLADEMIGEFIAVAPRTDGRASS